MRRHVPVFLFPLFVVLFFVGMAYAWEVPVDAPISDNWRPPVDKYASGNRGVDFATNVDTEVRAAKSGTVSFAGQVGGTLYVVVDHAGSLRTTYGDLKSIAVAVGQAVSAGEVVGKSGAHLHFGVRRSGEYLDPNLLFGRAVLVPTDDPGGLPLPDEH